MLALYRQEDQERDLLFVESGILITIIFLGHIMENISKGKTAEAIRKLPQLQATTGILLENDEEKEISVKLIQIGDILKVLPGKPFCLCSYFISFVFFKLKLTLQFKGSKIPVDGEVVFGSTSIDESFITGESKPVSKKIGAKVIGATVNQNGLIHVRAEKVGPETMLSRIIAVRLKKLLSLFCSDPQKNSLFKKLRHRRPLYKSLQIEYRQSLCLLCS